MADKSKIEWLAGGASWNPIVAYVGAGLKPAPTGERRGWACAHVSEGCRNCYAERLNFARRFNRGTGLEYTAQNLKLVRLELNAKILQQPLHWRKPRRIFPCSMTDLFLDQHSDTFISHIFGIAAWCPQHTFLILTKRIGRAKALLSYSGWHEDVEDSANILAQSFDLSWPCALTDWPLPNVWLGVSVEDQATADERIPLLLQTPAAMRWVSYEPALGPVDLSAYVFGDYTDIPGKQGRDWTKTLDWAVAGGESGPHARPSHPDWFHSVRDQYVAAGVPFFFKQWGEWLPISQMSEAQSDALFVSNRKADPEKFEDQAALDELDGCHCKVPHTSIAYDGSRGHFELRNGGVAYSTFNVGKKFAGRLLDGREWNEFPTPDSRITNPEV